MIALDQTDNMKCFHEQSSKLQLIAASKATTAGLPKFGVPLRPSMTLTKRPGLACTGRRRN